MKLVALLIGLLLLMPVVFGSVGTDKVDDVDFGWLQNFFLGLSEPQQVTGVRATYNVGETIYITAIAQGAVSPCNAHVKVVSSSNSRVAADKNVALTTSCVGSPCNSNSKVSFLADPFDMADALRKGESGLIYTITVDYSCAGNNPPSDIKTATIPPPGSGDACNSECTVWGQKACDGSTKTYCAKDTNGCFYLQRSGCPLGCLNGECRSCVPDWQCGSWSNAADSCGQRTCTDKNGCGTSSGKPYTALQCPSNPLPVEPSCPPDPLVIHCDGAVYRGYPDCVWDESYCVPKVCGESGPKPCAEAVYVGYSACKWDEAPCQVLCPIEEAKTITCGRGEKIVFDKESPCGRCEPTGGFVFSTPLIILGSLGVLTVLGGVFVFIWKKGR